MSAQIRPFTIDIPQEALDDLDRRLAATRWPAQVEGTGWDRGVPVDYLRELVDHWRTRYDWRAAERELNAIPQFTTEIDGTTVHFVHVRSPEPDAVPIIMTHGWPGSFAEYTHAIGPLVDPRAHGRDPADAFDVVIPSIPGYGFSLPLESTGWGVQRVARAWAELMRRLGYDRYVAQGGDWGTAISIQLGLADPEHVAAVHLNMLATYPPDDDPGAIERLGERDAQRLGTGAHFGADGLGFQQIMSTRPNTLSFGLADSPVGLAAWITEKFADWSHTKTPEDAVDRDHMLTIVMLYWLTNAGASSAQLYAESSRGQEDFLTTWRGPWDLTVPVGVQIFPADAMPGIESFARHMIPTLCWWTDAERGGHWAQMEEPEALTRDIAAFSRSVVRGRSR
jgi:epoxide hydrolase